jgi:diguanylate cyclase (GGDEF)-like protein
MASSDKQLHRLQRQALVSDLLRIATESPEEQSILLDYALTYAMEKGRLGTTGSIFVTVPSGDRRSLELLLRKVNEVGTLKTYRTAMEYRRFASGEGFAGTVLKTGATIFSNNPSRHPAYKPFKSFEQLRSLACVPIRCGNSVMGVLTLHNGSTNIGADDVTFLQDIARISALGIRAFHNEMTGLPARALMNELTDREIEARASGTRAAPLSLAYMDLDGFGRLNKNYDHDVGDRAIREFARRIRAAVGKKVVVCHLHGDEFALIFTAHDGPAARDTCEKLREAVNAQPFKLLHRGNRVTESLTASVGVVEWSTGLSRDQLVGAADTASNAAKSAGKNTVVLSPSSGKIEHKENYREQGD